MSVEIGNEQRIYLSPNIIESYRAHQDEIATYLRELPGLLAGSQEGKYALVKGDDLVGVWEEEEDALEEGCKRFGLSPIFVKKIDRRDPERYALFFDAIKDQDADGLCRSSNDS